VTAVDYDFHRAVARHTGTSGRATPSRLAVGHAHSETQRGNVNPVVRVPDAETRRVLRANGAAHLTLALDLGTLSFKSEPRCRGRSRRYNTAWLCTRLCDRLGEKKRLIAVGPPPELRHRPVLMMSVSLSVPATENLQTIRAFTR